MKIVSRDAYGVKDDSLICENVHPVLANLIVDLLNNNKEVAWGSIYFQLTSDEYELKILGGK